MAAKIREARPNAKVELHGEEDKPGTFDVVANSKELWSKHETGKFPEPEEIIAKLPGAAAS